MATANPFSFESIMGAIGGGDYSGGSYFSTQQEKALQRVLSDPNYVMTPEDWQWINAKPYTGADLAAASSGMREANKQSIASNELQGMYGGLAVMALPAAVAGGQALLAGAGGAGAAGGEALIGAGESGLGTLGAGGGLTYSGQGLTSLAQLANGGAGPIETGGGAIGNEVAGAYPPSAGGTLGVGADTATGGSGMVYDAATNTVIPASAATGTAAAASAAEGLGAGTTAAASGLPFGLTPAQLAIGGASLLGSGLQAGAALIGSRQQANAAQNAANLQRDIFNTLNAQGAPYREAGYSALGTIKDMQPFFTHQFNANDLTANLAPNWAWSLAQGQKDVRNAANAQSGLLSGNTLRGIADYTLGKSGDLYQQAFTNYTANQANIFNRLANIAGLGNQAYATSASSGANLGNSIGNSLTNVGTALGGGTVGVGNALAGGLTNAASWYALPQLIAGMRTTG